MEKNNVESVCLFLQLLKLRVQKMFIKKRIKKVYLATNSKANASST
ncbi:hypothetical protein ACUIJ5_01065 [Bacillus toyonensis]